MSNKVKYIKLNYKALKYKVKFLDEWLEENSDFKDWIQKH